MTEKILIAWQKAHKQAEDNVTLLKDSSFTDLCIARMSVCTVANSLLYSLPVKGEGYPEELERHLKSNSDKGCSRCWASSLIGRNHPECNKKISEWFASQEELLMFAELMLEC